MHPKSLPFLCRHRLSTVHALAHALCPSGYRRLVTLILLELFHLFKSLSSNTQVDYRAYALQWFSVPQFMHLFLKKLLETWKHAPIAAPAPHSFQLHVKNGTLKTVALDGPLNEMGPVLLFLTRFPDQVHLNLCCAYSRFSRAQQKTSCALIGVCR